MPNKAIESALPAEQFDSPRCPLSWQFWWSSKGDKMDVKKFQPHLHCLLLASSAAALEIRRDAENPLGDVPWKLTWEIVNFDGYVKGHVDVSEETLRVAFGLAESTESRSPFSLLDIYEADVVFPGAFIRARNRLNIPGPGTNVQGDPNISIYVSDEIREAVQKTIEGY